MPSSIEHIRAGKLRALAVTTATRSEALPDIPTVGEFVPGYEASAWYGIGAPKNTPAEIVDKLNKEINAALADPKDQGAACRPGRHGASGLARRLRQAHRRRNREVGQGDPGGQHQSRSQNGSSVDISITSRSATPTRHVRFQIWVRSGQCAGASTCAVSFFKAVVWSAVWPLSWAIYLPAGAFADLTLK